MASETHTLNLEINAAAAKRGSREFTAAVKAVKQAVTGLEKDTDGLFTKIKKTTTAPAGKTSQAAAFTSMRTAARAAESQVATLQRQLNKTGNASGIKRADSALEHFRNEMAASVRTTEDLRLAKDRLAQTLHEVREEARAATEVQRLRTQYQRTAAALDPLTTGTHAYRRAVLATEQAHRAGAISTHQMNQTLARAKEAYIGAGSAAENYAAQQARLYGTRAGWGMGRQLGLQVNQMAQVAGMSTSVEQALKGISYQAADVGLAFGTAGIAIGTVAGVALPLLIDRLYDVIPATKTVKEALAELDDAIEAARTSAGRTGDYESLRAEYGALSQEVLRLVEVQERLARIDAAKALREARDALFSETADVGWLDSLAGYAANGAGQIRMLRDQLNLTTKQARTFAETFRQAQLTNDAAELADHYANLRQQLVEAAGGAENLDREQAEVVRRLVEAEDAARQIAGGIDSATGATNAWAGAMSGVRAEINAILSSLSAIGGGVISNAAKSAELQALEAGKSVRDAAVARERYRKEQEFASKEMAADARGGVAGWLQGQMVEAERYQFEEGLRLDAELDAARTAAREAARSSSSSGSGRTKALTDEQKAVVSLTKSLNGRLTSLREENLALELVASGQFKTEEGARAMAEAMSTGTGVVDAQTAAMIRQIDAAAKLNEELRKVAEDPVKKWMDSVPNWIEAGQQIEMGAINHLKDAISEMIKTGKFDMEALGDAILGTIADIVADKAVKELHTLLGGGNRENGGLLGGLFGSFESVGDPATAQTGQTVAQGGMQAGQSISTAMVQAGQTVSQQISQAMTQGGQMTGQQVQQAHAMGGQQAANAQRAAGIQHGQQVRLATNTSGNQHATRVKTAIETGGREHASMVRSAASGSTGTGGFLDFLGGPQGLIGMAIGAFDEGGYSTAPANFSTAPISAFRHAPHFSEGTPNTSGIPAILHDNEAVVNLTKGRKIPVELNGDPAAGGGQPIVQNFRWDVHTADADSFRRSKDQIARDMAMTGQRAMKNG